MSRVSPGSPLSLWKMELLPKKRSSKPRICIFFCFSRSRFPLGLHVKITTQIWYLIFWSPNYYCVFLKKKTFGLRSVFLFPSSLLPLSYRLFFTGLTWKWIQGILLIAMWLIHDSRSVRPQISIWPPFEESKSH